MNEPADIVAKLRAWARGADEQGVAEVVSGLNAAADELERLYAENDRLRAARDEWIAGTVHHARRANGETEAP